MRAFVGTSGFSFAGWKGTFYPAKTTGKAMLSHYGTKLDTVEINNTFYKLPTEAILKGWSNDVPAHFRFSVKAQRYLTHSLKLLRAKDAMTQLYALLGSLGERLGPLLVLVPPFLEKDMPRLEEFLEAVPRGRDVAVEFRHASWFAPEVYAALDARGVSLVATESDDEPLRTHFGAPFAYVRLRKEKYDARALDRWAKKLRGSAVERAFVYVKHEDEGTGPKLAQGLAERLR
ncbi:DUF72 domain-containing protein [soil metagenome]